MTGHPRVRIALSAAFTATVAASASLGLLAGVSSAEPSPDPSSAKVLAGKTVFLDPGHQGTNHSEDLSKQVDDGRGGTKECQTTGMTAMGGTPEHTITWNVAQMVRSSLESLGANVVMSRSDDSGWGGCITDRAAAANASKADVAVSIHADGAPADAHGFHLIIPQLPIPDPAAQEAQSGRGLEASKIMRDTLVTSGYSPANYAGAQEGLQTRADVAGPALTHVPLVFVEMGNGANTEDAQGLETEDGQRKHAVALTTGITKFLVGGAAPVENSANKPLAKPAADLATPDGAASAAKPLTTNTLNSIPLAKELLSHRTLTDSELPSVPKHAAIDAMLSDIMEAVGLGKSGDTGASSMFGQLIALITGVLNR